MILVIPSTLNLHSWTVITGLELEQQSISPNRVKRVRLTISQLSFEDWPFFNAYTDFQLISRNVLLRLIMNNLPVTLVLHCACDAQPLLKSQHRPLYQLLHSFILFQSFAFSGLPSSFFFPLCST